MRLKLSEEQVRELITNLQSLSQQESQKMRDSDDFLSVSFHNGRSTAFNDAAGILLMALCVERTRREMSN